MYAIVGVAGKQFKVMTDQVIRVPLMAETEEGQKITLDSVLLISDGSSTTVGKPTVAGATVMVEVVKHGHTKKQLAAVYKRRKDYRRRWGFRAEFTEIKVGRINLG